MNRTRRQAAAARRARRPFLELLENRQLLATIQVVNTNASGTGSLAKAIATANGNSQANIIDFTGTIWNTPQTITLGGSVLDLTDTHGLQTITGPSAGVTISGAGLSGVFKVESGVTATITGLTITDGASTYGGGIYNKGTLTVQDCSITGNSAAQSAEACTTRKAPGTSPSPTAP